MKSNYNFFKLIGYIIYVSIFIFGLFYYPQAISTAFLEALRKVNQPLDNYSFIIMNLIAFGPSFFILYKTFPIFIYPGTWADQFDKK